MALCIFAKILIMSSTRDSSGKGKASGRGGNDLVTEVVEEGNRSRNQKTPIKRKENQLLRE